MKGARAADRTRAPSADRQESHRNERPGKDNAARLLRFLFLIVVLLAVLAMALKCLAGRRDPEIADVEPSFTGKLDARQPAPDEAVSGTDRESPSRENGTRHSSTTEVSQDHAPATVDRDGPDASGPASHGPARQVAPREPARDEPHHSEGEGPPRPKAVIVVDDLGYNMDVARALLAIDASLTFSILPFLTHSPAIAKEANRRGREVILHLPMEPWNRDENPPGKGTLFVDMADDALLGQLRACLEAVPFIVGVSNHMGSRMTERADRMRLILAELSREGLFFLDSRTSRKSVGARVAGELGLATAQGTLFLDRVLEREAILGEFKRLGRLAKRRGEAIGICHPSSEVMSAFGSGVDGLKADGVEIVPLSVLVR